MNDAAKSMIGFSFLTKALLSLAACFSLEIFTLKLNKKVKLNEMEDLHLIFLFESC